MGGGGGDYCFFLTAWGIAVFSITVNGELKVFLAFENFTPPPPSAIHYERRLMTVGKDELQTVVTDGHWTTQIC